MLMRVACAIYVGDVDQAIATYTLLSEGWHLYSVPMLRAAGTPAPQVSDGFVVALKEDSVSGIYDTMKSCALLMKYRGSIGVHVHNARATNSYITGTNGLSNGLVPLLRNFDATVFRAGRVHACTADDARVPAGRLPAGLLRRRRCGRVRRRYGRLPGAMARRCICIYRSAQERRQG